MSRLEGMPAVHGLKKKEGLDDFFPRRLGVVQTRVGAEEVAGVAGEGGGARGRAPPLPLFSFRRVFTPFTLTPFPLPLHSPPFPRRPLPKPTRHYALLPPRPRY